MTTNQPASKFAALQTRAKRLFSDAKLAEIARDVSDTTADVAKLPGELARLRSRGYMFASYLEHKIEVLSGHWNSARQEVERAMDDESRQLRAQVQQVENLLAATESQLNNMIGLLKAMPALEQGIDNLESSIKTAETRIKNLFATLERDVSQTVEQLQELQAHLDQRDKASFPFLTGENIFLTASGEWVAAGKGGQDPDGILFLTDQRLIFEQNEKTGKTLGLFGGKHTQEIKWEFPLQQIEKVEAENKGLFGGKDMLHFTLGAGARYPRITVEVKGKARCKFWAAQIERMMRGETKDERAIPLDADLETLDSAPTTCHVCGATLPPLTVGQTQITCQYCGSVIGIGKPGSQPASPQPISRANVI